MNESDKKVFEILFTEACDDCFGFRVSMPLSEPDCRHMSNKILEQTGLVIGAKSIRNYSLFIGSIDDSKQENPSVATLDTFARYVLDAPYINEAERQEKESDYPYWFRYRSKANERIERSKKFMSGVKKSAFPYLIGLMIVIGVLVVKAFFHKEKSISFTDNFNAVIEDSLYVNKWIVRSADTTWWNKRAVNPGHLTLYTLKGDNWPLGKNQAGIQNMLSRKIGADCFSAEVHLSDFIPSDNWQQAGILLSEDLNFTGKMIRLSISYNDFFGGYSKPPEIIVQAISSGTGGSRSKPEELAHHVLFSLDSSNRELALKNLAKSALKIEKNGTHFRFLSSTGTGEAFTFSEIASADYNFKPAFLSIFAIQGWADSAKIIPAYIDSFSINGISCK